MSENKPPYETGDGAMSNVEKQGYNAVPHQVERQPERQPAGSGSEGQQGGTQGGTEPQGGSEKK